MNALMGGRGGKERGDEGEKRTSYDKSWNALWWCGRLCSFGHVFVLSRGWLVLHMVLTTAML